MLMVDGPSLGGFVCPATITSTELWKMGQVRPGDSVRFRKLTLAEVRAGGGRQGGQGCRAVPLHATAALTPTIALLSRLPTCGAWLGHCMPCAVPARRVSTSNSLAADPGSSALLQAYTQRFQVDHQVSLVSQLARGVLSAQAAEADMAAFKVGRRVRANVPGQQVGRQIGHALQQRRTAPSSGPPSVSLVQRSLCSPPCFPSLVQVDVPETPPTEAVLRVVPAVEGRHPGAQVGPRLKPLHAQQCARWDSQCHASVFQVRSSRHMGRPPLFLAYCGSQVRLAGDRYVFLEYGPMELDINLRVR